MNKESQVRPGLSPGDRSARSPFGYAPSPRDGLVPGIYQKLPQNKETYLAYVVAMRDPLNYHLDIYWPDDIKERYTSATNYKYTFVSEELEPIVHERIAYSCHLKGVEIIQREANDFSNMKEAYVLMSKQIIECSGWVLVSASDIDIYHRVLVNIFHVIGRKSLNQDLLNKVSSKTNEPIAREYTRPVRNRQMFSPQTGVPRDYHIVY